MSGTMVKDKFNLKLLDRSVEFGHYSTTTGILMIELYSDNKAVMANSDGKFSCGKTLFTSSDSSGSILHMLQHNFPTVCDKPDCVTGCTEIKLINETAYPTIITFYLDQTLLKSEVADKGFYDFYALRVGDLLMGVISKMKYMHLRDNITTGFKTGKICKCTEGKEEGVYYENASNHGCPNGTILGALDDLGYDTFETYKDKMICAEEKPRIFYLQYDKFEKSFKGIFISETKGMNGVVIMRKVEKSDN